ncbi:FAD-dependent monooxygenase [Rhodobacteraceae bacterium F11138]|nr:FAD-dependent monooxygenase [Rhodobacteraceae bacterium F11138]
MQFHLNGFRIGDPSLRPRSNKLAERTSDKVDVLIIGCGPAGLTLAAQLAQFADLHTMIVDQKSGPLEVGQADGVACRSIEMFEAFGFAERVLRESYWVNETTFWGPTEENPSVIGRTGRIQDVADDLSEMPHVILNQARIHDFYLEVMRKSPSRLVPQYDRRFVGLKVDHTTEYPVTVSLEHKDRIETVRAKYVVGCDGARSSVRKAIGAELVGEAANKAWGVMDVLVDTGFPDIRFKSVVRSAEQGNILIIPREGGYMVRLYVEMETLTRGERAKDRNITIDELIGAAQRILHPYHFDVKEVAWWSVYEIGQRLCSSFDNATQDQSATVFIAGDACHTHSPKAGQGMNVSMGDAFNLGWKLAAVLRNQSPDSLLATYSMERQSVAQELIDFDRHWAKEFSERGDGQTGRDPKAFQDYFEEHGKYTAGVAVQYAPSLIRSAEADQSLATGLEIGTRFHSAPVTRLWDARPMHLGHALKADGRWRLMLFNNRAEPTDPSSELWQLCEWLMRDPSSPLALHTPAGADLDSAIDVRTIFQQPHRNIPAENTHPLLTPKKGRYGLSDTEKMFCARPGFDIFERRGIDRSHGCAIILRPDQYIADINALDAYDTISRFLDAVFSRAPRV